MVSVQDNLKHHTGSSLVEPGVTYPSYRSMDEFIDVEHLRSLDGFITEHIERHIREEQDALFLNEHRLDEASPYVPGVREIWLSRTVPGVPYDYLDLDRPKLWEPTEAAAEFAPLMEFIAELPFAATGRMIIIYDDSGAAVPAHRDHLDTNVCNEFIWFRSNRRKPFYVLNEATGEKEYVRSHSAWFDTVNQYHGSDAADGLSFSIRVDGIFTEELRGQVPRPKVNPASAASLWACTAGGGNEKYSG